MSIVASSNWLYEGDYLPLIRPLNLGLNGVYWIGEENKEI